MKKVILFPLLLIISATSFCRQTNNETAPTNDFYIQKSKQKKTAAIIILLSGFVLAAGTLIISSKIKSNGNATMCIVYGIIMTGALCFPVSLGLYIASSLNHSKAMHISFKKEMVLPIQKQYLLYAAVPSLNTKNSSWFL